MDQAAIGFWLVPAEPARSEFARLIETLRVEQDAPSFGPHITLFVQDQPTTVREDSWQAVLARAAQGMSCFEVPVQAIGHSERLFKTLFLEVALTAQLQTLHERLRAAFVQPSEYVLKPHLSLLYKELPRATREQLAQRLQPAPAAFSCDRILATSHGPGGWTNIASWTEIASVQLNPSAG